MTNFNPLLTLSQILDLYPFTMGQMRSFLMIRKENGLDKAIRRMGKRLYFRQKEFEEWIESYGSSSQEADEKD